MLHGDDHSILLHLPRGLARKVDHAAIKAAPRTGAHPLRHRSLGRLLPATAATRIVVASAGARPRDQLSSDGCHLPDRDSRARARRKAQPQQSHSSTATHGEVLMPALFGVAEEYGPF